MRKTKLIISVILCIILVFSLCSCGEANGTEHGSGEKGEIADIGWEEYDTALIKSEKELDVDKRAMYLHQAEDKIVGDGFMIPIFFSANTYLVKPYLEGVYIDIAGPMMFTKASRNDGEKDVSVSDVGEPENLDPVGKSTSNVCTIDEHVFAGLTRHNEDGENIPELCESYGVSDDGKTYTFEIRDGLKWSDGTDLDANDFEYSWKRAASSENGLEYGSLYNIIKGYPDELDVSASEDGRTFTVNLNNPCVYFLDLCSFSPFYAVQKDCIENDPGYKNAEGKVVGPSSWGKDAGFVSSGPYIVSQWKHNEKLILKKNPYYYDADNIKLDTISYMITTDSNSSYAAYMADNVSAVNKNIPLDMIPTLKGREDFHAEQGTSTSAIVINPNTSVFRGMTAEEASKFRRAMGFAIDRKFAVNVALTGVEKPATTFVRQNMSVGDGKIFGMTPGYKYPLKNGYYPESADLDTARELLESIGFEFNDDGKLKDPVNIEYVYNPAGSNEAIAVCIQADLANLGINAIPAAKDFNVYLGERNVGKYEMARYSWTPDYNDPYGMLACFKTGDPSNCIVINK